MEGSFAAALKQRVEFARDSSDQLTDEALPGDLVAHILHYVSIQSLCVAAASCRQWRVAVDAAAARRLAQDRSVSSATSSNVTAAHAKAAISRPPPSCGNMGHHTNGLRPLQLYIAVHANFLRCGLGGSREWVSGFARDVTWRPKHNDIALPAQPASRTSNNPPPLSNNKQTNKHAGVYWEHAPHPPPPPSPTAPPPPPAPVPSYLRSLLSRQFWRQQSCALREGGAVVCCGGSWGEAVQAVDVHAELQRRGLGAGAAAAGVLDAGLALRLSLWVGASGGGTGGGRGSGSSGSDTSFEEALARDSVSSSSNSDEISSRSSSSSGGGGGSSSGGPPPPSSSRPTAHVAFGLMLDDGSSDLRSFGCFVRRTSSHQFYSGRLPLQPDEGWVRLEHVVSPCPRGFRRAVVLLRGRGAVGRGVGEGGAPAVRFGAVELCFVPRQEP